MGSDSIPLRLPKIDLSGPELHPGSESWAQVRAQVQHALESYGCFEAVYTKVPPELRGAVVRALQQLFDLPIATKLRNRSRKPFHGYVGQYPQLPLYESMGIDDANLPDVVDGFTGLMWPEGNQSFSDTICAFSNRISELDHMVRMMVLESLGVDKYCKSHLESTNYLLRVMKYKGPETKDARLGLNSHTDKNIVTILYQSHGGLEVQTKDGAWFPVETTPDSFIVMVGDSFMAWSNGRLHSAHHRVMMTGSEERYSAGLFSVPRAGHIVEAPEELVDGDHPLLFKPFDHVKFLQFYYTEEAQKMESALKAYCGVPC